MVLFPKLSECTFRMFGILIIWKPLWLLWTFLTSGILVCGVTVLYFPNFFPKVLGTLYKYGKTREVSTEKSFNILRYIEVPKSWFRHFYLFAWVYASYILWVVFNVYVYEQPPPTFILIMLDTFLSKCRHATLRTEDVLLVSILYWLQVSRRIYECYFVSVFSKSYMNVLHYVVGYCFYFASGLSLLAEAPGFSASSREMIPDTTKHLDVMEFSWRQIIGVSLFSWAFIVQYRSLSIFAGLRKDEKGAVVTYKHCMPSGYWFDFVSCPHYLAEIFIYVSMLIILGIQATTWWFVIYWVISNQVVAALLSHQWYKKAFINYPKYRKAIFPYLL